jgi:low affinity Fe/Cu permease
LNIAVIIICIFKILVIIQNPCNLSTRAIQ